MSFGIHRIIMHWEAQFHFLTCLSAALTLQIRVIKQWNQSALTIIKMTLPFTNSSNGSALVSSL